MAHVNTKHGKKITKKRQNKKYKNKNKMFSICSVWSLTQCRSWKQSSLQPSTVFQHRHLLQTTSYNHLLLLHHLISRKEKPKQQQARNPPLARGGGGGGGEKPEGPSVLQPTTESEVQHNPLAEGENCFAYKNN